MSEPETNEYTTLNVKQSTKKRFEAIGRYGDSADDILNRLLDLYDIRNDNHD